MTAKSSKKSQTIPFVTGWLVGRYSHITKPDTEGKFADGKFKTDGILDNQDMADAVREKLLEAAKTFWPDVPADELRLPLKMFMNGRKGEEQTEAGWGLVRREEEEAACGRRGR